MSLCKLLTRNKPIIHQIGYVRRCTTEAAPFSKAPKLNKAYVDTRKLYKCKYMVNSVCQRKQRFGYVNEEKVRSSLVGWY